MIIFLITITISLILPIIFSILASLHFLVLSLLLLFPHLLLPLHPPVTPFPSVLLLFFYFQFYSPYLHNFFLYHFLPQRSWTRFRWIRWRRSGMLESEKEQNLLWRQWPTWGRCQTKGQAPSSSHPLGGSQVRETSLARSIVWLDISIVKFLVEKAF